MIEGQPIEQAAGVLRKSRAEPFVHIKCGSRVVGKLWVDALGVYHISVAGQYFGSVHDIDEARCFATYFAQSNVKDCKPRDVHFELIDGFVPRLGWQRVALTRDGVLTSKGLSLTRRRRSLREIAWPWSSDQTCWAMILDDACLLLTVLFLIVASADWLPGAAYAISCLLVRMFLKPHD